MPAAGCARLRGDAAALAFSALLVFVGIPCGARAAAAAETPASGPRVIVRTTLGAPVASLELWFRAPSAGFDAAKPSPGVARLAAQAVAASKPIVGEPLDRIVGNLGGRLMISAFSDAVSVIALVPSGGARQVLGAMTRAYFAPVLTDDGNREAARAVAIDAAVQSFNPEVVGRDAVFAALFASGPAIYPPGGEPQAIGEIPLDTVRSFAKRAFRAQNAVVVITGRVTADLASAVAAGRPADPATSAAEPPLPSMLAGEPGALTRKLDDTGGALGWAGPPILDERSATALDFVADYLFRPGSGTVAVPLAEKEPTASISGQFITLRDPGVFLITYTSKNSDELRSTIERALADAQKPLDPVTFARALDGFTARIATDVQTASEVGDNLGWYTVEGNPQYAPIPGLTTAGYFAAASSLTPAFVAETARKYLGRRGARVTFAPPPKTPAPKTTKAGA